MMSGSDKSPTPSISAVSFEKPAKKMAAIFSNVSSLAENRKLSTWGGFIVNSR